MSAHEAMPHMNTQSMPSQDVLVTVLTITTGIRYVCTYVAHLVRAALDVVQMYHSGRLREYGLASSHLYCCWVTFCWAAAKRQCSQCYLTSCRCSAVIHDEESWILIQCVWVCIDILYLVYIIYGVCVRARSHDSGPQSEDLRIKRHCCAILMCLEH